MNENKEPFAYRVKRQVVLFFVMDLTESPKLKGRKW
jgi:hypothetical protein